MEMQPHEKLNFYLNWAYVQNRNWIGGFRGYDAAEPVLLTAEEFDEELCRDVAMDLSWVDDAEYYHDGLERSSDEPYEPDAYADGEALASIGWGTDEDYGYYGE